MASLFIDSSALVKRYQDEAGSRRVAELLESAEQLMISRLTIVEVSSALIRRARMTRLPPQDLTTALANLDRDATDSFQIVELEESAIASAVALARKHALRAADAVQLACLLLIQNEVTNERLVLLSADYELNAAATLEGFQVENPNSYP